MSRRGEALLAASAALLVYALTRSGNHSETEDSVAFAVRVRDADWADLLEGGHLVYLAVGRAVARILDAAGLTRDPLLALQVLDMVLGAAAVGGVWLLLRRVGSTRVAAAAGAGTVAWSYGFWRNAIDAEVYALSALALVVSLAAAWVAARLPSVRFFALLGLANGFAVLAHVTSVLFAVASGTAVLLAARATRAAAGAVALWTGAYVAAASVVVVAGYGLAAALHGLSSTGEFREWFTERAETPGTRTLEAEKAVHAAFGSGRALVGGHFALGLDPIRDFLTERFAGKTFREELFFLEGFPDALAIGLLGAGALAAALVAVLAVQWVRRPELDPGRRTLALLAVAWLVPFALFLVVWDPLNIEFWPMVWLPAAVLLGIATDTIARPWARAALALSAVAALFLVNLVGSVLPQHDKSRDFWRAKTAWYRANAADDDLVISNGYIWSAYLRYLVDARIVDIEDLFREAESDSVALFDLRRHVASAPARVLVSGEAFDAFEKRKIICIDAPRTCEIATLTAGELRDECRVLAVMRKPFERVWSCRPT